MSTIAVPTVFRDILDLARLPYFGVSEDGCLTLTDTSVGPIIDVHTHLALAFLRPMQVDLYQPTNETQHYLPACCQFDLDIYANKNFTHEQLHVMERNLVGGSLSKGGMRATHTVPNLLREMDLLGMSRSIVLPIDFPAISNNAGHALKAAKVEERLIGFGSVHPYSWDITGKMDDQGHGGALGFKVHPGVQMVHPADRRAMKLYRVAGDRGLPIIWHCGPVGIQKALGEYFTQVRNYEKPIAENPKTTFILGHSGGLQWEAALALCCKYPNVYMEASSQPLSALKVIVATANPDRLLFGTDWPFYHQALTLAKVLLATEGRPDVRAGLLYRNAMRLLKLDA